MSCDESGSQALEVNLLPRSVERDADDKETMSL